MRRAAAGLSGAGAVCGEARPPRRDGTGRDGTGRDEGERDEGERDGPSGGGRIPAVSSLVSLPSQPAAA